MIKKFIVRFFILIGAVLCLYIGFLYFSYLDEKITTGTAYGLKIGISKKEAYEIILKKYGEDIKKVRLEKDKKYIGRYPSPLFLNSFNNLAKYTGWEFYFDEIQWNYLYLEFQEGKLVTIHRHRQYYELP